MSQRLLLFAKLPRAGKVKTRLAASIGVEPALAFYRACLADQLGFLAGFGVAREVEVCLDGLWDPGPDGPPPPVRTAVQGPGDLGARLSRAFVRSVDEGVEATVVMGSDSPTLPRRLVEDAFAALDAGSGSVLSPSDDGGYVVIGARGAPQALFHGIPWGGPEVASCTRSRAAEAGIALALLDGWYDVDDVADLARLRRELADPAAAARAPSCAALLRGGFPGDAFGELGD